MGSFPAWKSIVGYSGRLYSDFHDAGRPICPQPVFRPAPGVSTFVGGPLGLRRPLRPVALSNVNLKRRRLPHLESSAGLCSSLPLARQSSGTAPLSGLQSDSGEAFVAMDRWLGHARCGPPFLRPPAMAQLVPTSIQYGSVSKLPDLLQAATAKRANLMLQRSGQPFGQDESDDRLVRHSERPPGISLLAARPERYAWSAPGGRPARPPQAMGLPTNVETPMPAFRPADPLCSPPHSPECGIIGKAEVSDGLDRRTFLESGAALAAGSSASARPQTTAYRSARSAPARAHTS